MLKKIKKEALNQAMKLMSNPKVAGLLTNPKVMGALAKGFELQGQIRNHVEGKLRALAQTLNLATQEDVSTLKKKLDQVEHHVGDIDAKLQAAAVKKRPPRKKAAPKSAEPAP